MPEIKPQTKLRFSTEPWSLLSALIRWRTMCKQSHVEFELPDGCTLGSRFSLLGKIGRRLHIKRWELLDGVQIRPPSANKHQRHVIYATFPGIDHARVWGARRLGMPYDVKAIMGIVTGRGWYSPKADFCSDFIDVCATSGAGIMLLNNSPWATTPRDILVSPYVLLLMNDAEEVLPHE